MAKKAIFEYANAEFLALTYDDVRLRSGESHTMPDDVDITSRFSRNVPLVVPIVSAAMDTVTEYEMGIAMAQEGGLGIIHKNLSPKDEAKQVARVKHHLNGLIERPIIITADTPVEAVLRMREEKGYSFHSFPIVDAQSRLVGIVTEQDFQMCRNLKGPISTIMTVNPVMARRGISLDGAYDLMCTSKKKLLPLVDEDRKVIGMYVWSDVDRIKSGTSSNYNLDDKGRLRVGAAVGVLQDAFERVPLLVEENVDVVVIDTAHGDTGAMVETIKALKGKYPTLDLVVGNISEAASAKRLVEAGADGIKVGQGGGSICTTRIVAGIGCPQVTAVYNCAQVGHDAGVPVCADGGGRYSGDIPIAIGAGADSCMFGMMLAVCMEAPGKVEVIKGKTFKVYRGMGSLEAMKANEGSRQRYAQSGKSQLVPEGIESRVEIKGDVATVMVQYTGGLRKGMGYVGAASIKELQEKGEFWRLTTAGKEESHPHDVEITHDAPNYPRT